MNFLQLVQRYRQETGYASTGPTTVVGQTGDHAKAVDWVSSAYVELQNRLRWRWLRRRFTLTTASGTKRYVYSDCTDVVANEAIDRFREWIIDRRNQMLCYLQSSGESAEYWVTPISWEQYRQIYLIGSTPNGPPAHVAVDPSNNLVLGPTPNDVYVLSGEYHRGSQVLAADDDTPEMPSDYHMLIVYAAMMDYGYYEVANEVLGRGREKHRRLLRQLEASQAPKIRMAGPLA
ncbi:hypothetical protein [Marinobacterium litorale]|uniref:phage adaptor protein n=1 Tax=Marinobacterium litorale TaxID=404770 RepID=UPI0004802CA2|nr:hypothetical protein [Marinobacterium litorale]